MCFLSVNSLQRYIKFSNYTQTDKNKIALLGCGVAYSLTSAKTVYHCYFKDKNNTYEYSTDRKSLIPIKQFDEDKILSIKK